MRTKERNHVVSQVVAFDCQLRISGGRGWNGDLRHLPCIRAEPNIASKRPPSEGDTSAAAESVAASSLPPAPASSRLRTSVPRRPIRWTLVAKLLVLAAVTSFAGRSLVVVPDGEAGVRVSQISGVRAGNALSGDAFDFPADGARGAF